MSETLLCLRDLCKQFGNVVAADNVNLEIAKGEFVTFLGPSGSGKTTILMMVAGFLDATTGDMRIEQRPLGPLPAYEREIGMVFQHYALFPHMTVFKNVAFPLEMRKLAKDEIFTKVNEILELVGLPQHGDRYPKQLSGGQQQRVALARAMVFKPRLLLMDEPLGALDKKLREHMQIEIMRLHRDLGITILYVTHDQEEALVMSDRIAVFNEGRIEQIGSPSDLYENPRTHFVADFIGESNFIAGKVVQVDNGFATVEGSRRFTGRSEDGIATGKAAVVAVRPERLCIRNYGEPGEGDDNEISATVSNIVYLGQSCKFIVKAQDDIKMMVLVQANVQGLEDINIGSEVTVSWSSQNCKVLPDK